LVYANNYDENMAATLWVVFQGDCGKAEEGGYLFMGLMFGAKLWQWQIIDKSKRQTPWAVCFYGQWNAVRISLAFGCRWNVGCNYGAEVGKWLEMCLDKSKQTWVVFLNNIFIQIDYF